MKIKGIIVLSVVMTIMLGSCAKHAVQNSKMKTDMDSLSYAFGVFYYGPLSADSVDLDPVLIAKAMMDGKAGSSAMTEDEARTKIMAFVNKREADRNKDYIEENEKFLADNKQKAGVNVTSSGLQYEVIKMGTGEKPTAENTVKVHYTGSLIDGKVFDTSVGKEPAEFPLSSVIPGWTEAVQLMPVGSKFKFWLPSELAYGANGMGEDIKPFSTLVFEVELLEIVN